MSSIKPLGGSIGTLLQPLQKGSVSFFFEGDDGGSRITGGTGGNNHQQSSGDTSGANGGNNQQQNQQQQQPPVDPFKDIDLELLAEPERNAVIAARAELTRLNAIAQTAQSFQSRYDQTAAELARLKAAPTGNQQQQQNGNQQQQEPLTFEQELKEIYISEGVPADQAGPLAKLNAKVFGRFAAKTSTVINNAVGPLADTVAMREVTATFNEVSTDPLTGKYFRNLRSPSKCGTVWKRTPLKVTT
jgi:hypothetical protein